LLVIFVAKDANRVTEYNKINHGLDFSGIEFPTSLKGVAKFEKQNNISINVYGADIKKGIASPNIIQTAKRAGQTTTPIDLLLLHDATPQNQHFCWIKNFSSARARRVHAMVTCAPVHIRPASIS
jgi:hypothetical protein